MSKQQTFTLIDVFRVLQREPEPRITWAAGAALRERWREGHDGEYPTKALRPKTAGAGSHCFAVYPMYFWPLAEQLVRDLAEQESAQLDLFGETE